mmetsp:Transcript_1362/g.3824  ORF Transcript_1362/g.3824 Transcript_1362/m.3824 type:complete len:369 (-) Transcript_1362:120-1226(-)
MAEEAAPLRSRPLSHPETLIVVDHSVAESSELCGQESPQDSPGASPAESPVSPGGAYERLDIEENSRLRNWKQGESLGRGAYGEVYKAMVSGRFMAVKKIPLDLSLNPKAAEKEINTLLLEINTLKRLKHPRIVRYHGCVRQDTEDDPALLIFLEFMPSGSIKAVLTKFGAYGSGLVRKYTREILEGLEFLHAEKIVHRDIKGANILIDAEGNAKLADFGACKTLGELHNTFTGGLKSIHGSVYWMAPEVMKYKAGRRSDIWSLGCTVIEMMTADAPWHNLRSEKLSLTATLKRIMESDDVPPLPERMPSGCRSFLDRVLVRDYEKRDYAPRLLQHPFLAMQDSPSKRSASGSPPAAAGPKTTEAWGN